TWCWWTPTASRAGGNYCSSTRNCSARRSRCSPCRRARRRSSPPPRDIDFFPVTAGATMRYLIVLAVLVVLAVEARMSLFTVDPTEFVYITEFGRHVATYDGDRPGEAGLYWRWPWPVQSVQRLDRRLQHFDLPPAELLTHDPKGKTIDKTLTVE